jgi:hypothetical protein
MWEGRKREEHLAQYFVWEVLSRGLELRERESQGASNHYL